MGSLFVAGHLHLLTALLLSPSYSRRQQPLLKRTREKGREAWFVDLTCLSVPKDACGDVVTSAGIVVCKPLQAVPEVIVTQPSVLVKYSYESTLPSQLSSQKRCVLSHRKGWEKLAMLSDSLAVSTANFDLCASGVFFHPGPEALHSSPTMREVFEELSCQCTCKHKKHVI